MSDNKDDNDLMFSMQKDTAEIAQLLARGKSPRLERIQESLAEDAFTAPMEIIEEELRGAGLDPEQIAREGNLLVKPLLERNQLKGALLTAAEVISELIANAPDGYVNVKDIAIAKGWLRDTASLRDKKIVATSAQRT